MVSRTRPSGFTLVELIASAAVIALLMLMLVQMSRSTGDTWRHGMSKAEEFRESRRAFEVVTRRLALATLNTYWDYQWGKGVDPSTIDQSKPNAPAPTGYRRESELRFRVLQMDKVATELGYHPTHGVFFQSPTGGEDSTDAYWSSFYTKPTDVGPVSRLDSLLASWGYFLEVSDVTTTMPPFLAKGATPQYRSRLMEFREDAKNLSIYKIGNETASDEWFTRPLSLTDQTRPVHPVAENIIAMVMLPKLSATDEKSRRDNAAISAQYRLLSPTYDYDSKAHNNYGLAPEGIPVNALPNQINPYNQLPPIVQVAMFALDQNSATRLAANAQQQKSLDLTTLLQGLFQKAEDFEAHDEVKGDLAELESRLHDRQLNYRLFVSDVSIRGARWSASETDIQK